MLAERCTALDRIGLASTRVTDEGIRNLNRRALEELRLDSNQSITDVGLRELSKIPSIRSLYLYGSTNLTEAGVVAFEKAHPECEVFWR